ncbi:MAG: PDZ domain-containing protein [Saprospiraceae bacterium]
MQSFIILETKLESVIPLKLIFDTGAEHNLLFNRITTDVIQDAYQREVKILGSDLSKEVPALLTQPLNIQTNNNLHKQLQFIVLLEPIESINELIGEQIDGILSASFFMDYNFEINYKKQIITLRDKKPNKKKLNAFKACDISLVKNKPYIKSTLKISEGDSVYHLNLLLDTGAGLSLLLYKNAQSTLIIPKQLLPGKIGSGIGGLVNGYIARSKTFEMCDLVFDNIVTCYQEVNTIQSEKEALVKQGIIGNQVLEKFDVIFDYADLKIYFKQNSNHKTFEYDRSGLAIVSGDTDFSKFYVAQVIPNSPGEQAGFELGDRIISINHLSTNFMNLGSIQRKLSRNGQHTVTIKVERNGKTIKSKIKLVDLL